MRSQAKFWLAVALIISSSQPIAGQTPATSRPQDEPKIRIGTAEVALDVVVRDKKGRQVKDLTAADFEVYEDGARQTIESFRLVGSDPGATGGGNSARGREATAAPAAAREKSASPGVVALVFDRLAPEARALARKAATAYADDGSMANDFTGVFAIDLSFRTLQPYTSDPQLIRRAIETATSKSVSTFASNTEQVRNLADRGSSLERQSAASLSASSAAGAAGDSAGAAAGGQAAGRAMLEQTFVQMQIRMSESFETLERNQQGYATINSLLALISSMRNLPGRKTVIFFSEGLALPPAVIEQFKSVINAANRANVSIYAVDAAGLRIDSPILEATREITSMGERRMNQAHTSRDDTSGPMMKSLERNEDLLRLNPHSGLGDLADQTGGFLIRDTNDLTAGLRRIDEDMRFHYVVTYVPKNPEYDGRFRQISLKLSRSNLEVQTRKGYYAIDGSLAIPVLSHEVRALAALNALSRERHSNPFAIWAGGLSFPAPNRPGLTPILVEVPAAAFTLTPDREKKTYSSDFSILVLVKDGTKQVVQKLSQHYPLSGPLDKVEAAGKGEILFYREVDLPPGQYSIEAIAYDAPSGKASLRVGALEVLNLDEAKLRLSSLTLLKRAERLTAEEQQQDRPLHFGEVVVYPNLGEPLRKSAVKQLAFFFTAWPGKGATGQLQLTIEVLQNNRRLAQLPGGELPAADQQGRVRYASALPLDKFQPGGYELRVTVKDGESSASRSTPFSIEP
ncbi:MAG TPA: VWA domain-containing protein [Blastocatellia bacterium]|nr:VWA domain-containing protein [Blastocatellia bacterium]